MLKVSLEQRHLFMLLYQLQNPRSIQLSGILLLEFVYIWILYSALARACEEDVLQRINIGLIHISFLEERIMTKYVLKMAHTFLTEILQRLQAVAVSICRY